MWMRRPSTTTLASSVSGTVTPDIPPALTLAPANHEPLSALQSLYSAGSERLRLTHSERSPFVRPPLAEGASENGAFSFGRQLSGSYSPQDSWSPAPGHSGGELLQARQHGFGKRRGTISKLGEDTLHEELEMTVFQPRRSSMPVHSNHLHVTHTSRPYCWGFKSRAMPYSGIPVGRVSPITPLEHRHPASAAASQLPKPVEEQVEVVASRSQTNSGHSSPLNKSVLLGTDSSVHSPKKKELGTAEEWRGEEEAKEKEEEEEKETKEELTANNNAAKARDTENIRASVTRTRTPDALATSTTPTHSPVASPKSKRLLGKPQTLSSTLPSPHSPSKVSLISQQPTNDRFNGIERTLHKSRNFIQEIKALAESGSSDQDSDVEPLATHLKAVAKDKLIKEISAAAMLPAKIDHHMIKLRKDGHADFGFSLSDGLGEPGVYVKKLTPGGVAEQSGKILPFDRIMKVIVSIYTIYSKLFFNLKNA